VYAAFLENRPLELPCRNFNAWINSVFLSPAVAGSITEVLLSYGFSLDLVHYIFCYLRNFIGAMIVYYGTAATFHYVLYVQRGDQIFANRSRPTAATMWDQIQLAQSSMILYVMLPVVDEYLIESGYTPLVYFTIDEIGGWLPYLLYTVAYFLLVEIGIYWMHRTLHTNKTLYKYIHLRHHVYNKPETLTPWASIAFHPLDGILQASPYVMMLFVMPCHYLTHVGFLFATAVWATYIHDAMECTSRIVMGCQYHTIHHTHYIYNYGQVFTLCDWWWGTLKLPSQVALKRNTNTSNATSVVSSKQDAKKSR
jgi:lathosterol oxidase